MDSADSDGVRAALQAQGRRIHIQEEQLTLLRQEMRQSAERQEGVMASFGSQICSLVEHVRQMQPPRPVIPPPPPAAAAADPVPASAPPAPGLFPHLSKPDKFSGDSGDVRPFLTQCGLHFELQAAHYPTDRTKVAYIISHLCGRAEAWATAEFSRGSPICASLDHFSETFTKIFQHIAPGREAARALTGLCQGRKRVTDYAIAFRTLAADSGWNEPALFDAFLRGLSDPLKDQLAPLELPADLDSLISLAIKIDKRLEERERARSSIPPPIHKRQASAYSYPSWRPPCQPFPAAPPGSSPPAPEEPMQLGRTRLAPEERQRRMQEGRCIYCGQLGHRIASCPVKDRAHQ